VGVVASREGEERATESVDEAVIGDIETFLQEMVEQFGREQPAAVGGNGGRGPGRPKVLPALALWAGVVCVLRGQTQQLAVRRLLILRRLWEYPRFPVTDQAVYNRLERDGTAPLEQLFAQVSHVLAAGFARGAQGRWPPLARQIGRALRSASSAVADAAVD